MSRLEMLVETALGVLTAADAGPVRRGPLSRETVSIELPEGYRLGWSYIPHFINTRFYTYAYSFAHLASLVLYGPDMRAHATAVRDLGFDPKTQVQDALFGKLLDLPKT